MHNKISIIIPIYNVLPYIKKCINSVINQTYKNIEIILVDDGSTDGSEKYCDKIKQADHRIKVYHKQNGGLSDARNYGIEKSTGDYLFFLDSDDYISKYLIELLYQSAKKYASDLVISSLYDFHINEKISEDSPEDNKSYIISKEECYKQMFMQNKIDVNATAKLYSRKIFSKIRFPKGALYEDIQIIDKTIEASNIISIITFRGYYYLQRKNSTIYSDFSKDKLILINKMEELVNFINKNYPNISNHAIRRYIYCNFHLLGRSVLDNININISRKLKHNILQYKKTILFSNLYNMKEKTATIILLTGISMYRIFWKYISFINNK